MGWSGKVVLLYYSFDLAGERKGLENCPIKVDLNHGTALFITVLNE